MRRHLIVLATATVSLLAATQAVTAGNRAVRALPAGNLIVNGDAEAGPAGNNSDGMPAATVPGWTTAGEFSPFTYVGGGGYPDAKVGAAIGGGKNFFSGGRADPLSTATQTIDLTPYATEIDARPVPFSLGGYFGGYSSQEDSMVLKVLFKDESGGDLAGGLAVGGVTAAERKSETTMLPRVKVGTIPSTARSAVVTMVATRRNGSANDGYADNVYLRVGLGAAVLGTPADAAAALAAAPLPDAVRALAPLPAAKALAILSVNRPWGARALAAMPPARAFAVVSTNVASGARLLALVPYASGLKILRAGGKSPAVRKLVAALPRALAARYRTALRLP